MLWSIGKDSTALLYMIRKAFFGRVPFPVINIDTPTNFGEAWEFRDNLARRWGLELIVRSQGEKVLDKKNAVKGVDVCCGAPKTEALKNTMKEFGFDALLLGIRRDEHGIRAKERVFSPRNQSFQWDYKNQPAELWGQYSTRQTGETHLRVHPLLHWTEKDIWKYIEREKIPVVK